MMQQKWDPFTIDVEILAGASHFPYSDPAPLVDVFWARVEHFIDRYEGLASAYLYNHPKLTPAEFRNKVRARLQQAGIPGWEPQIGLHITASSIHYL